MWHNLNLILCFTIISDCALGLKQKKRKMIITFMTRRCSLASAAAAFSHVNHGQRRTFTCVRFDYPLTSIGLHWPPSSLVFQFVSGIRQREEKNNAEQFYDTMKIMLSKSLFNGILVVRQSDAGSDKTKVRWRRHYWPRRLTSKKKFN